MDNLGLFRKNMIMKVRNPFKLNSILLFPKGYSTSGVNNVNISSYERQFQLASHQSSWVSSMYDVGAGLSVS